MKNTTFGHVRVALAALACLVLAACTQSASSSYGGKIGGTLTETQRTAKIEAARKRARAKREADKKAFFDKRRKQRERRRAGRSGAKKEAGAKRSAKRSRSATRKATSRSRKASKRTRSKAKSKSRRVAAKRVKKKRSTGKGRAKKVTSAFVGRPRGLRLNAPWKCVPGRLKRVIKQIRQRWGAVTVNSTHRSKRKNRLVGGKRRSYHLRCQAVDFRVHGSTKGLTRWLARNPSVGGYNRYPSGYYHIDTGPKRTW